MRTGDRSTALASVDERQIVIPVAEDEVIIRNLVTMLMQHEGYFLLSAADGREGPALSRNCPGVIDLAIADLNLPRLNGSDLWSHLLEERPGSKVLVMSGADMQEIVDRNDNLPFIPKPFDGETPKAKVWALLAAPVEARGLDRTEVNAPTVAEQAWEARRE